MENNGCVVSAVFNYTERLAADYTSGTNQICSTAMGPGGDLLREPCALAFLTHFTGDIHQPLHAGYASDQGGNLFDVSFFGAPAQLHGVWDYDIIDLYLYREVLEWDSFAAELIAELKENPDVVESYASVLNADDWASESFEIMRETSYNFQPGVVPLVPIRHNFTGPAEPLRWERVTAREYREEYECMGLVEEMYYTRNLPVVKERLAMAGVRLATTLNNVYQAPAAPKSPLVAHAAQKMAELRQHQAEVGSAHSSIYYNVVCPANVPGKGCPCSVYPCYA